MLTTHCQHFALKEFKVAFNSIGDNMILDGESMHLQAHADIINLVVNDGLHETSNSVIAIGNMV